MTIPNLAALGRPSSARGRSRRGTPLHAVQNSLAEQKLEYQAAMPSRFRKLRSRLGGTADAHLVNPHQYRQVREYARDMARNDAIIGSITWKAVNNILRTGLEPDPMTGDAELDKELRMRWGDWSEDKNQCDSRAMHTFGAMQRMALYSKYIDGDIFGVLTDDGSIQMVEGDWVTSPMNLNGNVLHGVEMDDIGRPLRYWFLKRDAIHGRFAHQHLYVGSESQVRKIEAIDRKTGHPNVLHVFSPDRFTQHRGITVFHAVFDRLGMLEDADFARLVQTQLISYFAIFLEMDSNVSFGARETSTLDDGTTETVEDIEPGTITRLRSGEKPHGFSPNIPNPEYFPFVSLQLRLIGNAIGLPLEIAMFDMSQTTFHGYRGALQQAYIGFQCQMKEFSAQFCSPVYRWKVAQWLPELGFAARSNENIFRHRFQGAGFPYVNPKQDAEADEVILRTRQSSPRRLAMARGHNFDELTRETAEDRANEIREAKRVADELEAEGVEDITWQEILTPGTATVAVEVDGPDDDEEDSAPSDNATQAVAEAAGNDRWRNILLSSEAEGLFDLEELLWIRRRLVA